MCTSKLHSYWWAMFNIQYFSLALTVHTVCCVLACMCLWVYVGWTSNRQKLWFIFIGFYNYFWLLPEYVVGWPFHSHLFAWISKRCDAWMMIESCLVLNPTQFKIESKTKRERRKEEEEKKHHPTMYDVYAELNMLCCCCARARNKNYLYTNARLTHFHRVCVCVCVSLFFVFPLVHATQAKIMKLNEMQ